MYNYSRTIHPNGTVYIEVKGGVKIYYPDNTYRYVTNEMYEQQFPSDPLALELSRIANWMSDFLKINAYCIKPLH